MAARMVEKLHLSAKGLLGKVRQVFSKVSEPEKGAQGQKREITIVDCLMSALAVFKLKFPSLLQFEKEKAEEPVRTNLRNLFGVNVTPCDTYMRERLDEVQPSEVRSAFTSIFSTLQRGKVLERYEFLDGNKSLFEWLGGYNWDTAKRDSWHSTQILSLYTDKDDITHKFHAVNKVPLNDSHPDLEVNFLEYWAVDKNGVQQYHNTWVTDIQITEKNCYQIAQGGRARWKIENETFNTLKNQGYHFEHNYGHGYKNLSTVFAMLMMLAFLIDQAEQISCGLFQGALKRMGEVKSRLWRHIRQLFETHIILSWEALYRALINKSFRKIPILDST